MFWTKPASVGFLAILMVMLASLPQIVVGAEQLPRTVLIIDGSGSMWGRIDEREKIVIARELLADNIKLLKGKTDLGVMSYGHRRRRDCRDIEMIVPIGPVKPQSYGETIKRLLPRGKTPVASALQMAADTLAAGGNPEEKSPRYHIILVADGIENCRLDPCETASTLASKYPGLSIDVIGFAVPDTDLPKLQCISNNSRGQFHRANNTEELKIAIAAIFTRIGPAKSSRTAQKKQPSKIPPGLYLTAGLAKNSPPLQDNVAWRIYKQGESSKTGAPPLKRITSTSVFWKLPKGRYHIEARHQNLLAEEDVDLSADKALKRHLSFEVGVVTANARLESASPVSSDIIFSLYDASSGQAGPANIIAHKQEKNAIFYLPPGKYSLKARAGETQTQHDFTLKAGERLKHTLLLDAGQISLTAHLANETLALDDVQYAIYRRGESKDREFVRTLDPNPELVLPAGDYIVLARQGAASHYTRLKVQAGESKAVTLTLNAGILKLSSNLDEGSSDQQAQIAYTIKAVGPVGPKTVKLSVANKLVEIDQSLPTRSFRNRFVLPAGEYVVQALYGNSNAQATAHVQVKAGEESSHKIIMSAGRIKLSLTLSAADQPLPGVFWSILDPASKQVASASSISPALTLSSGAYQAVADYLGESYRRDFTIENGDNKKVQVRIR